MEFSEAEAQPRQAQTLTFKPGIKGLKRFYKVRSMIWQGRIWLCAKDVGQAVGWHPDTLRHRREALTEDGWGYATMPTPRGAHMMVVVSVLELSALLKGSSTRQARAFRRWLEDQEDVATMGDAGDFVSDGCSSADHLTGAEYVLKVQHPSKIIVPRRYSPGDLVRTST